MTAPTPLPDRYELYERAAQSPERQAKFLRALHPAPPGTSLVLGEDFCGAGALSRAWTQVFPGAGAICIDHDPEPLARLRALGAGDIKIIQGDVRSADAPADIIATLNFSICELKRRSDLLDYLGAVRKRLRPDGLFVADLYGGVDAFAMGESDLELRGGVRYIWEQREADPLTGLVVNAMHFELPDGTRLEDAFVYHWRLWSAPELQEAMLEAGFDAVETHDRLGDAVDSEGRVYLRPVESPDELDENFVIYLAARTPGG
ncbi:MAG: class I SAM-dependent methyltransferase [Phycisphaeraceae bacterium]|nr:MAG: class I SAM-dependent methyltransferase [Phycisphaeraceae bacterium]